MDSDLFGSGVPIIIVGENEINIENSYIEDIEFGSRYFERETINERTRLWEDLSNYDHVNITVIIYLFKNSSALETFKNNIYAYNKILVDGFRPSQTADALSDSGGNIVKFRMELIKITKKESPWAYDVVKVIFKSKKPVNLNGLQVTPAGEFVVPTDTDGLFPTDTGGVAPTN